MSDDLKVPAVGKRLVGFIQDRPFVSLVLGLMVIASLISGVGKLQVDFTYRAFFNEGDELLDRFDAFEREFGNDDAVVVAMHSPSGIFDVESATLLAELTERIWDMPDIIRVESLSNFNWVHAEDDDIIVEPLFPDDVPLTAELMAARKKIAMEHETLPNYLISEDAKTAMLFAFIIPGIDAPPDNPKIVHPVRELVAELTEKGDEAFYLSGGPPLSLAFEEVATADMQALIPFVLLATIVLLIALMRSVAGVILPLVVVFLSVISTLAFAGHAGIKLGNVTTTLPQILIAIGIADSVHILVTFYQSMKRGRSRAESARYSLLKNFMPTVLTSISTAIGFLSFASADLRPVADLGILAAFGTIVAWIFTYLVLGSLLFMLPLRASKVSDELIARNDEIAGRMTDTIKANRMPIIVVFAVACLVGLGLSVLNEVNSDPFKYFSEGYPTRVANEFIEAQVGGARGVELVVDAGTEEGIKDPDFLQRVEKLQAWIETQDKITRAVSIVDILKQTHRSLHGGDDAFFKLPDTKEMVGQELLLYTMGLPQGMDVSDRVSINNDRIRVTVLWTIAKSSEAVGKMREIEAKGVELGLKVVATGKNLLWQSLNGYVVQAFLVSLTTAIVLISLLLIIFFRSVGLGLLAMIPNVVPLIAGGALLYFLGQDLDIGTVLVGAVCLGIAVDDTIHILSNYNRLQSEGKNRRDSVHEVIAHTTPALFTTTAILVISFGTFAFATYSPNMYFGILTALILLVALFTDMTFLPALLLRKEKSSSGAEDAKSVA
jgi:predicted RND superfamily exporter protein